MAGQGEASLQMPAFWMTSRWGGLCQSANAWAGVISPWAAISKPSPV